MGTDEGVNVADIRSKSKYKIGPELAEKKLGELLDYYELDDCLDSNGKTIEVPDDDDSIIRPGLRKALIRAFRKGRFDTETDDGRLFVLQHLSRPLPGCENPLRYAPYSARARIAMDGFTDDQPFRKMVACMASLSGEKQSSLTNIEGPDSDAMEALFIFLKGR